MCDTMSKDRNRFLKYEKPVLVARIAEIASVRKEYKILQDDSAKGEHSETDHTLDNLFPAKRIERENKLWSQRVSRIRLTGNEVLDVRDYLDRVIQEDANDNTSMHITADIYKECMAELIREEVVECPQRGLLLQKVTDVIFGVLDSFERLCGNVFAYGMLKGLQLDRENLRMQERLQKVKNEQLEIKTKVVELEQSLLYHQEQVENERKKMLEDYMVQEEILEESNQLLEEQLEVIVDPRTAEGKRGGHFLMP